MRYAIYLTPPWESALADAARDWLGRCAFTGRTVPAAAPHRANAPVPARYGFHATMRAPFRLASGTREDDLVVALKAFAMRQDVPQPRLGVATLGSFVALTANEADAEALGEAAAATLHAFERFRAPLTPQERERRRPDALDERGRALLDAWGYPHVMERFTFHMTLSGPLAEADVAGMVEAAREHFAAHLHAPQPLEYALFREDEPGAPFTVIACGEEGHV